MLRMLALITPMPFSSRYGSREDNDVSTRQ